MTAADKDDFVEFLTQLAKGPLSDRDSSYKDVQGITIGDAHKVPHEGRDEEREKFAAQLRKAMRGDDIPPA